MPKKTLEFSYMNLVFLLIGLVVGISIANIQQPKQQIMPPEEKIETLPTPTPPAPTPPPTEEKITLVKSCPGAHFTLTNEFSCKVYENNTNYIEIKFRNDGSVDLTERHFKVIRDGVVMNSLYTTSKGLLVPAKLTPLVIGALKMSATGNEACTQFDNSNTCIFFIDLPCADISDRINVVCPSP